MRLLIRRIKLLFNIELVNSIISQEILNFNLLCSNLINEILVMFNN